MYTLKEKGEISLCTKCLLKIQVYIKHTYPVSGPNCAMCTPLCTDIVNIACTKTGMTPNVLVVKLPWCTTQQLLSQRVPLSARWRRKSKQEEGSYRVDFYCNDV